MGLLCSLISPKVKEEDIIEIDLSTFEEDTIKNLKHNICRNTNVDERYLYDTVCEIKKGIDKLKRYQKDSKFVVKKSFEICSFMHDNQSVQSLDVHNKVAEFEEFVVNKMNSPFSLFVIFYSDMLSTPIFYESIKKEGLDRDLEFLLDALIYYLSFDKGDDIVNATSKFIESLNTEIERGSIDIIKCMDAHKNLTNNLNLYFKCSEDLSLNIIDIILDKFYKYDLNFDEYKNIINRLRKTILS